MLAAVYSSVNFKVPTPLSFEIFPLGVIKCFLPNLLHAVSIVSSLCTDTKLIIHVYKIHVAESCAHKEGSATDSHLRT